MNKQQRKAAIYAAQHPDECLVRDHRGYLNDEIVDYVRMRASIYPVDGYGEMADYPRRRCSSCGKLYIDSPTWA